MQKIAIFNHKGGVSKTTTSFNLGWSLSQLNKKVLLVDTDSQCNLSMYALGEENFEKHYLNKSKENIYSALLPAFKSQPRLIQAIECPKINENLYLLPGHLDFTENEVQLGIAMQLSSAFGSMENLPGSINYLVNETAKKYNIDYVIYDMNPSLSAINQDIFISSDYFIIPASPDLFSLMSIDSLNRVLPSWEKWGTKARPLFKDSTYPLPFTTPKFLGYTINDFNLSHGRPQHSFRGFMVSISDKIVESLSPSFNSCGMLMDDRKYKTAYQHMKDSSLNQSIDYPDSYCLAQISNFNKLIAISNATSTPVFNVRLNKEMLHNGQERTLKWFKFLYKALATRVLELTCDEH
ncbi:AAA family ATPase [Sporolactobacillus shoreicorticis]|uniref:ParA family protein n=1 Tax=Sporolactobacillus shoreicorticis TaxID=1923877 RepID=A0ABW5S9Y4_9BACL|nr:AAA family ATPase [Sporolactobacillus shoreicorticis]MCO7126178.1 AAA family ATPase [Sporolactobacillus shoreicorticis]